MTYEKSFDDEYARRQALARAHSLVCSACVLNRDLWSQVDDQVPEPGVCDFCAAHADETVTLDGVAQVVLSTVAQSFSPVAETNSYVDDDGEWTVDYQPITEILGEFIYKAVAADVEGPLEDYVAGIDDTDYGWVDHRETLDRPFDYDEYEWRSFAASTRASGLKLHEFLATLSPQVQELLGTVLKIIRTGGAVKTGALPPLWRGRPAVVKKDFTIARELGTPPDGEGGQNRMTAAGDSAFYGSTDLRGAVIELAQDEQDQDFWVGRFTGSRPVRYLDTVDRTAAPNPYSQDAADIASAHAFLRAFAKSVSQPKPPPSAPPSHYLPTQVFVDVLRRLPRSRTVEAVRYASSLDPSSDNWVVFLDQEHCVDPPVPASGDLFLVLAPDSPIKVNGKDFT